MKINMTGREFLKLTNCFEFTFDYYKSIANGLYMSNFDFCFIAKYEEKNNYKFPFDNSDIFRLKNDYGKFFEFRNNLMNNKSLLKDSNIELDNYEFSELDSLRTEIRKLNEILNILGIDHSYQNKDIKKSIEKIKTFMLEQEDKKESVFYFDENLKMEIEKVLKETLKKSNLKL